MYRYYQSKLVAHKHIILNFSALRSLEKTLQNVKTKKDLFEKIDDLFIQYGHKETVHHVNRVTLIAHYIFKVFIQDDKNKLFLKNLTNKTIKEIEFLLGLAARLHDIGKILMPPNILYKGKEQKLTDFEFALIKMHTRWGKVILKKLQKVILDIADHEKYAHSDILQILQTPILDHHERPDGKGYPLKLKHLLDNIVNFLSGLIATADCFEAMVTKRCYKEKLPYAKLITELKEGSGTQWHSIFVDIIIREIHEISNELNKKLYTVRRYNGSIRIFMDDQEIAALARKYITDREQTLKKLKKLVPDEAELENILELLNSISNSQLTVFVDQKDEKRPMLLLKKEIPPAKEKN
ncbi:HD-GYP domain-containing protein [Candidatus Margulisiibacteriota bacterium]